MSTDLRSLLATALRTARRAGDRVAADALRTVSAAIANAEAVPTPGMVPTSPGSEYVAGAVGVGSTEVPRRVLGADEVAALVAGEVARLESTAREYDEVGHPERAARLRRQAEVVRALLD